MLAISMQAQIISQWSGPQRNGIYPDTALLASWPEEGPVKIWSVDGIGKGYSSAAITDDAIFVTGESHLCFERSWHHRMYRCKQRFC